MLCMIEDVKRILVTQKNNITVGSDENDSISEENAKESIREADALIYSYLRGIYRLPLRKRILYKTGGINAVNSLTQQMDVPRQLEVVIRGTGDLADNNAVVITGTDFEDNVISEGLTFSEVGSQITANYFKTVDTNKVECGTKLTQLIDGSMTILSYDILSYICQRLAAYNLYRDVFSNNSPNELPESVIEWRKNAIEILEKIRTKLFTLEEQVAPDDVPILERPYFNIPTKFFEYRGVAGIERLSNSETQDYDGDHPHSTESGGTPVPTFQQQVIIPPDTWTSSTRPTTPYKGQTGFNTETEQFEGYNGTTWVIIG